MKAPAYQRYPKDYMSDGNVLRMNFEERGIYDWLLDSCWIEDGIPSDVGELARICSLTPRRMATAWKRVSACFTEHPRKPGWLTNSRLEKERQSQAEFRDAMSEAGKKGSQKRWGGHSQANSQATTRPMTSDSSAVRSLQSASAELQEREPTRAPAEVASLNGGTPDFDGYVPTDGQTARAAELHVDLEAALRKWRGNRKANDRAPHDLAADFDEWLEREPAYSTNGNGAGREPTPLPGSALWDRQPQANGIVKIHAPVPEDDSPPATREQRAAGMAEVAAAIGGAAGVAVRDPHRRGVKS